MQALTASGRHQEAADVLQECLQAVMVWLSLAFVCSCAVIEHGAHSLGVCVRACKAAPWPAESGCKASHPDLVRIALRCPVYWMHLSMMSQEQDGPGSIHAAIVLQDMADLELGSSTSEAAGQRAHNMARQSCDILQVEAPALRCCWRNMLEPSCNISKFPVPRASPALVIVTGSAACALSTAL